MVVFAVDYVEHYTSIIDLKGTYHGIGLITATTLGTGVSWLILSEKKYH